MWIDRILNSPTRNAIELTARFAEERHAVLAENAANLDTPDYHAKRLDVESFQSALSASLEQARRSGRALTLRGDRQFQADRDGRIRVKPTVEPAQNVLFHDGTNARLETLMTDVQDNAASYDLAINLLRSRFETLMTAIRGRTT
ncbi:MAG: hypothetical protein HZB38_01750 [Planctomycetes bacterium]|nr:hypothetical protein [Planctomycetota bacterium]